MSENLKSAVTVLKESVPKDCLWEEMDKLTNTPIRYVTSAMHSFAENAVREFAELVKDCRDIDGGKVQMDAIDYLRDQLISEIKEK